MNSVLRNPFEPATELKSEASDPSAALGMPELPHPDTGVYGWRRFWEAVPSQDRADYEPLLIYAVGLAHAFTTDRIDEALAELARTTPASAAGPVVELAVRSALLDAELRSIPGVSSRARQLRARLWSVAFGMRLSTDRAQQDALMRLPVVISGAAGSGKSHLAGLSTYLAPGTYVHDDASWTPAIVDRIDARQMPTAVAREAIFGRGKATNDPQRGILQQRGVLFIDDAERLDPVLLADLVNAVHTGFSFRFGGAKQRSVKARLVLCTRTAIDVPDFWLPVDLPSLDTRFEDATCFVRSWLALPEPALSQTTSAVMQQIAALPLAQRPTSLHGLRGWVNRSLAGLTALGSVTDSGPAAGGGACGGVESVVVASSAPDPLLSGEWTMDEARRWYAAYVRERCDSDVEAAAKLEINRGTLSRYLRDDE